MAPNTPLQGDPDDPDPAERELSRRSGGPAISLWLVIGAIQVSMDAGTPTSMAWQILPYALLTMGEVLVSATGLEFAYSQAPASMKGAIMALWSLAVTVGNLWVLVVNAAVKNEAVLGAIASSGLGVIAFQMYFFAAFGLMTVFWDIGARRAAGVWHWFLGGVLKDGVWAFVSMTAVILVTYLASFVGWFRSEHGYARRWAEEHPGEGGCDSHCGLRRRNLEVQRS